MPSDFEILESEKTGLNATEGYVVVRGRTSFLRFLGAEPKWTLMTATASEDHGRIQVCSDRTRLVESACRLVLEDGGQPLVKRDHEGREYIEIGTITAEPGDTDQELQAILNGVCRRFFAIFDECDGSGDAADLGELYESLATDDKGGDVYLSDGVWLSQDGSLHDRGR
jgi:hypothetical protein